MDQTAEVIEPPSFSPEHSPHPNHPHSKSHPVGPHRTHPMNIAHIHSFQGTLRLTTLPFLLLLLVTTAIIGVSVIPLGMLTQDYQALLTAENTPFFTLLAQITATQGLTHPLGILFNTALYSLAVQSPTLAHLIPYIAHILTGMLLAVMVSRKYTRLESALFGLVYIALPFFVGQYALLAQGNVSLALFVLALQLLIVQSKRLDIVVKSAFLVVLQIMALLLHESLLFSFIPVLLFLLPMEKPYFGSVHLRTLILLSIPSFLYLFLKIFVITRQPMPDFFTSQIMGGFNSFFTTLTSFFTTPTDYLSLWQQEAFRGISLMGNADMLILLVGGLIGLLVYELSLFFTHRFADGTVSSPLVNPLFWALLGVCTSIPYHPSALGFPLFCFFVAFLQLVRLVSRRMGVVVASIVFILSLSVTLGLLDDIKNQAFDPQTSEVLQK